MMRTPTRQVGTELISMRGVVVGYEGMGEGQGWWCVSCELDRTRMWCLRVPQRSGGPDPPVRQAVSSTPVRAFSRMEQNVNGPLILSGSQFAGHLGSTRQPDSRQPGCRSLWTLESWSVADDTAALRHRISS